MTRGLKQDMGPGLSHKTIICDLYFKGYTFSEIEFQTNHSESSVKRYLADFILFASLHQQGFSLQQIRLIAHKSERLIREYLHLYQTYHQQNNQRLHDLLTPTQPGQEAEKNPALRRSKEVQAMSKPLTKQHAQHKKTTPFAGKNLRKRAAAPLSPSLRL